MAVTTEELAPPGKVLQDRRSALAVMTLAVKQLPARANWLGMATIVAVLIVWEVLVSTGVIADKVLPSPTQIWSGLGTAMDSGRFWSAIAHTMMTIVVGCATAVVIGGVAGLAIGLSPALYSWTMATVDVLRSVPTIAFFPMAILLWGASTKAEIVIAVYAALWPVLVSAARSVRSVGPRLFDVARTLGFSRPKTFWKVVLPATGAATIVASRVALGITVVACVTMEMVGTPSGIGYEVLFYQQGGNVAPMWAFILTTGVLGLLLNAAFVVAVRLAFPGIALWADRGQR
ncbi:ABC transporter permease subunit [Streptomyces sp. NPDC002928]|uniref:ABC transporter permease n=1 Tax=Streptomyces sp. NPDC002928 TaxID=3154440 RepID=UPI0033A1F2F3